MGSLTGVGAGGLDAVEERQDAGQGLVGLVDGGVVGLVALALDLVVGGALDEARHALVAGVEAGDGPGGAGGLAELLLDVDGDGVAGQDGALDEGLGLDVRGVGGVDAGHPDDGDRARLDGQVFRDGAQGARHQGQGRGVKVVVLGGGGIGRGGAGQGQDGGGHGGKGELHGDGVCVSESSE